MRRCLIFIFAAITVLACLRPAGAQGTAAREITARQRRATALAAKGNPDAALKELDAARKAVRREIAELAKGGQPPRSDSKYVAEQRQLQKWLVAAMKKAQGQKAKTQALTRQFSAKQRALQRKYHFPTPRELAARQRSLVGQRARMRILEAAINDQEASIRSRRGDRRAEDLRLQAARIRIEAYQTLRQPEQADAAARKLVEIAPDDPSSYEAAASLLQSRRQFAAATKLWERGVRLIESGKTRLHGPRPGSAASSELNGMLAQFYRQLVFCYQQTGKTAEMRRAMEKAQQAERLAARPR
jgi:tetratricopeptide (TPR) repeat protein